MYNITMNAIQQYNNMKKIPLDNKELFKGTSIAVRRKIEAEVNKIIESEKAEGVSEKETVEALICYTKAIIGQQDMNVANTSYTFPIFIAALSFIGGASVQLVVIEVISIIFFFDSDMCFPFK